jgi:hypothetical protein
MAYADYRLCDACGSKTFYDSNLDYQRPNAEHPEGWWLRGLGDWAVLCTKCVATHEIIVRRKLERPEREERSRK